MKNSRDKLPNKPAEGDRLWASLRRLKAQVADMTAQVSTLRRDYNRLNTKLYRETKEETILPETSREEATLPAELFG